MGDWHDYVGLLPTAIAVASGFISLIVGQLFRERPRERGWLIAGAAALSLVAIVAPFYNQALIVAAKNVEASHRAVVRNQLSELIATGNDLMRLCADPNARPPIAAANEWVNPVQAVLIGLGPSYVDRLN